MTTCPFNLSVKEDEDNGLSPCSYQSRERLHGIDAYTALNDGDCSSRNTSSRNDSSRNQILRPRNLFISRRRTVLFFGATTTPNHVTRALRKEYCAQSHQHTHTNIIHSSLYHQSSQVSRSIPPKKRPEKHQMFERVIKHPQPLIQARPCQYQTF